MIYDSDKGDRGKVFSNGVEVDLLIQKVDTETGEITHVPQPSVVKGQELVTETLVLENVTFEPL